MTTLYTPLNLTYIHSYFNILIAKSKSKDATDSKMHQSYINGDLVGPDLQIRVGSLIFIKMLLVLNR